VTDYLGWSRPRVVAVLLAGIPLMAAYCLLAQWPLWTSGKHVLVAADLLVTVTFFATAVFVYAEPGHRLTGTALAAAALVWPLNWVNEWKAGPLPLIAALEGPLYGLLAVWALLRYPAPWPRRWQDATAFGVVVAVQLIACLQVVTSLPQWHHLPPGTVWLAWWPGMRAYHVSQGIYNYGIVPVAAVAVLALVVRLSRLTGPDRRIMRPVRSAIVASGIGTAATGTAIALHSAATDALSAVEAVVLVSVPLTFLIAAARRWLAQEWVPKLIRELAFCSSPGSVQDALRARLADPELRLLYRVGDGYVDIDGAPVPGPPAEGVSVITGPSGAAQVVLLTTSLILARYRDAAHAAARAAVLAIENTSLQVSISASIRQVAESAERLAAAVDAERRSVRGAVARICAAELTALADLLGGLAGDDGSADFPGELAVAGDLLSLTETDLTLLGAGLGPAGLARLGLGELLQDAARRLRPEISVSVLDEPLEARLRTAAYFVLSELMTNAVKHAPGSPVAVSAARDGSELVLEVRDGGPGGADPAGSGLRGIAERVAELSGSLVITSPSGAGTTVVARLPAGA
jgi:signal transduction histidine kinase